MPTKQWLSLPSLLLFIFSLIAASSYAVPLSTFSDSGWGFITLRAMQEGAPFNNSLRPNLTNISNDIFTFSSWWSPGQYYLPGIFQKFFRVNLGQSVWITVVLFSGIGLIGHYTLYRHLHFSKKVAIICCFIIMLSRQFVLPFTIYTGGEVLLFGAFPWILLFFLRFGSSKYFLPQLSLLIVGAFLKFTFIVVAIAIILSLIIFHGYSMQKEKKIPDFILYVIYSGALLAVFYYIVNLWLISPGKGSITDTIGIGLFDINKVAFTFFAPFASVFSFWDLANRLFSHPSNPILNLNTDLPLVLLFLAATSIYFIYKTVRNSDHLNYKTLLAGFYLSYTLIFIVFYLTTTPVSAEPRHFYLCGTILLPGFVCFIWRTRTFSKRLVYCHNTGVVYIWSCFSCDPS